MQRIKTESGYYYTEEFWHGKLFLIEAYLFESKKGNMYRSTVYEFDHAPYKIKSKKCKRLEAKQPQQAIKFAKDQIREKYKIPKQIQEWLDSDERFKRRQDYEWKKNQK